MEYLSKTCLRRGNGKREKRRIEAGYSTKGAPASRLCKKTNWWQHPETKKDGNIIFSLDVAVIALDILKKIVVFRAYVPLILRRGCFYICPPGISDAFLPWITTVRSSGIYSSGKCTITFSLSSFL